MPMTFFCLHSRIADLMAIDREAWGNGRATWNKHAHPFRRSRIGIVAALRVAKCSIVHARALGGVRMKTSGTLSVVLACTLLVPAVLHAHADTVMPGRNTLGYRDTGETH